MYIHVLDSKPTLSTASKRSREECYAGDSSSDEEPVCPKKSKSASAVRKVTKLVSSVSESEEEEIGGDALPPHPPSSSTPLRSCTAGVPIHSSDGTIDV